MKRIDWSWRGFSFDFDHYQVSIDTPLGGVAVDKFRDVTPQGFSRGRCREFEVRIPIYKDWQLHLSTPGKDYLTLVDGPKYLKNLSWILDEFDYSFNDLAIASLRYHLDWSVCSNEDRREQYEDIIARLAEESPDIYDNAEEKAIVHAAHWPLERINEPKTPEYEALMRRYWKREEDYNARINQARHDFVDIMRMLWS